MASRDIPRNMRGEGLKEFAKILDKLAYSRRREEVFSDWAAMAAWSISNSIERRQEVEEQYLRVAEKYTAEELSLHARMIAIVVNELEAEPRDVLGELYMGANLGKEQAGQFFTPFSISRMMAGFHLGSIEERKGRIVSVSDPACGSGGTLVAMALAMLDGGVNYQYWAYFEAQDIDPLCCRMAYIQLALLGMPAAIICGDTLAMRRDWVMYTPQYHIALTGSRLSAQRTNEIARALVGSVPDAVTEAVARAVEDTEADEDKKPFDITLGPQLDLFGAAV